jgi:hypothetical protein
VGNNYYSLVFSRRGNFLTDPTGTISTELLRRELEPYVYILKTTRRTMCYGMQLPQVFLSFLKHINHVLCVHSELKNNLFKWRRLDLSISFFLNIRRGVRHSSAHFVKKRERQHRRVVLEIFVWI